MRVLWIFNHPAPYKIDFFNELGKNVELDVIFERRKESDRDPMFYCNKAANFSCEILDSIWFGALNNYSSKVVKRLKAKKYDIIVMNGWRTFTEMKAIRYLKKHDIPYIFAINGGIIKAKESKLNKKIKTKYISGAAAYLAPDENSASYLSYYGADQSKINLYPYSTIHESEILPSLLNGGQKEKIKNELGLPKGDIYISAGQFIPRKNDLALINIWKKMDKSKILVLVGSGVEKERYEEIIKTENIDNIVIKPYMPHDELLRHFMVAESSILLTREDIYGHVVNESLSQGCPVIGSDKANSSKNLIKNGINGYLVNIEKENEISDSINSEISDEMRENAIETARKNTIELMSKRHLEIFEEYLDR